MHKSGWSDIMYCEYFLPVWLIYECWLREVFRHSRTNDSKFLPSTSLQTLVLKRKPARYFLGMLVDTIYIYFLDSRGNTFLKLSLSSSKCSYNSWLCLTLAAFDLLTFNFHIVSILEFTLKFTSLNIIINFVPITCDHSVHLFA